MTENQKNPSEYGYKGDEQITVNARFFKIAWNIVHAQLEEETKLYYPEKYKFVDKETGKDIKKVTKANQHKAVEIVDVEATVNSKPRLYRTEKGQALLKVNNEFAQIHFKNVQDGIAKHHSELEPNQKEQDN